MSVVIVTEPLVTVIVLVHVVPVLITLVILAKDVVEVNQAHVEPDVKASST